jgi:hypothetical protein
LGIEPLTPKALANFSPKVGVQRQPWDNEKKKIHQTLKGFVSRQTLSGLNRWLLWFFPGLSLRSNHWAEISERLRR